MTLGNENHFFELSQNLFGNFLGFVSDNVILHPLIGQTLVGVLLGIGLDLASANSEGGEVLTGLLKQFILAGHGVLHHLSESGVHFDHILIVLNEQLAFGVHAANNQLQHGGGVCGAIFAAAGAKELQAACNALGPCGTGHTAVTPGFKLKAKYIIHAVGPRWKDGKHYEAEMLYNCYKCAMMDAQERGCHSIAFPLISSGIYGYPLKEAWKIAIRAIQEYQAAHPDYHLDAIITVISDDAQKLGTSILNQHSSSVDSEQFLFFWHEYEPFGVFSQWFKCSFVIEGIRYETAEQYMMAKKALMAGDLQNYVLIMNESDPEKCKKLGKKVRNLDVEAWAKCKEEIVYHANLAKFSQNEKALQYLLSSGNKILVEASPYDTIWGIGLEAADVDSTHPDRWRGQNLLGKILMRVRDDLKPAQHI